MVAIDSVQTSLENFDSVKRTMAVRDMEIGQPQLWYVRKSAAHGKEMGNKKQTTPSPDYNKRWHYRIGSIMLDKGSVNFLDESIRPAGRLRIDNIRGELKNLNSAAGEARYSIAASLASGGMESKGTIALAPSIQVKADTDLSHLELSTFNPWLTALSNTRFAQGAVDSNGSLHITKTNPLQLSWQGNTQIHHLDVRHASSGVQYVGWNDAQANGIRLTSLSPVDVQINKLHVTGLTQKNINQVKQAANLLGFIGALTGNKKLTSSANSALIDSITLNNISYGPSGFKLGGSIGNGLESLLLGNLNSFLTKLPR